MFLWGADACPSGKKDGSAAFFTLVYDGHGIGAGVRGDGRSQQESGGRRITEFFLHILASILALPSSVAPMR